MKKVDMNALVLTREGTALYEPKLDAYGKIILTNGNTKRVDQLLPSDEWEQVPVSVGKIINLALDKADDKLTAEERRKRWILSVKIQTAMTDKVMLELSKEDINRILTASDELTNTLFLGRIYEILE